MKIAKRLIGFWRPPFTKYQLFSIKLHGIADMRQGE